MLVPEFLADLRRLYPGVHQDPVCVRKRDQPLIVVCVLRVLMPSGDVQDADAEPDPLFHKRLGAHRAGPRAGLKVHLEAVAPHDRTEAEILPDVLEKPGIEAVSLARPGVEPGREIDDLPLAVRLSDGQWRIGVLVDAEDLVDPLGVELRRQLRIPPHDPLFREQPVPDAGDLQVGSSRGDAQLPGEIRGHVGDDAPPLPGEPGDRVVVVIAERIDERIRNEQEVIRSGSDLLADEEGIHRDVHALHDPGEGGLVVERRSLRKLIPEYGHAGFLP